MRGSGGSTKEKHILRPVDNLLKMKVNEYFFKHKS